ncbi:MAG: fibrobacter succinogenes major paralogous domain-containing protein [Bacteroidales bacterium]|jgi:uncharacterized protein (TIGR02145 family)|nr:fibrobacter succinogenes major paralogous domain-containing protein [Bacteroidales bacterium]
MKKFNAIFILFVAVQFTFGQNSCNDSIPNRIDSLGKVSSNTNKVLFDCNDNAPGWGNSLGKITFLTNQTWFIGNQEWSDVVIATNCKKDKFNADERIKVHAEKTLIGDYTIPDFDRILSLNADCRRNKGYGDLFSWCAVSRFRNQLCPDNWHIPTVEDFKILHTALGGQEVATGLGYHSDIMLKKYIKWGATYGGWCTHDGELRGQNYHARYWTQTKDSESRKFSLFLYSSGNIIPEDIIENDTDGLIVRCVRSRQ